jgi:hypothetical protein
LESIFGRLFLVGLFGLFGSMIIKELILKIFVKDIEDGMKIL